MLRPRGVLLWRLAWLASAAAVWLADTIPWSNFQGHAHWAKVCWIPFADRGLRGFWPDVVQNIALLVPFGFTGIQATQRKTFGAAAQIVILAALVAAFGELFEVYCHNRFPSMTDVTTGTGGALIGVLIGRQWFQHR